MWGKAMKKLFISQPMRGKTDEESLKLLGTADFVVFAPGWQDYRGCRIEHDAAVAYGIPIVEV